MPMKVIFQYGAGPWLEQRLRDLSSEGLVVESCDEDDDRRFDALLATAEVIWHVLKPITAEIIGRAPRLRLIQKIGVGVNTIDLDAARARGIPVCNMPGTNSRAVAEMTLLLMLAALRRLSLLDRRTREGLGWVRDPRLTDVFGELDGVVVGLVGYGAVPQILAPCLAAPGATVLYTARAEKPDATASYRPLDRLLADSDIVSLHVPLTPETEGLLDRAALARMKPGAILVNTARGALVDEAALVEALRTGRIAAAGLDVFAEEPVRPDNPLLALDNVALAPHVAWLTRGTLERSLDMAVENCRRLTIGEPLLHRVV